MSGARAADAAGALERRFPALVGRLDRLRFTTLPTPVEPLRRLGSDCGADLWIKRDDRTAQWYGGNKPRKLEFALAAARAHHHGSVLTFGALGSHHALATAIAAPTLGLRAILVLVPQPLTAAVRRQLLLDHAYGAELHYAPTVSRAALLGTALTVRETLRGRRPLVLPPGGTSTPGVLAFVEAGLELAEQIAHGEMPEPSAVFVPLGTGGTAAGLVLGFAFAGLATRVVAVLVTDVLAPTHARVLRLARRAGGVLHRLAPDVVPPQLERERLVVIADELGGGYGAATTSGETAARRIAEREGITVDSTYTAKCLAALLKHAARSHERRPLLFWHTYGEADAAARVPEIPDAHALPTAFRRFFSSVMP